MSWQNVVWQKGKSAKWHGADGLSLVPLLSWDDQTKRGNFVTIITPLLDFVIHTLKITPRHCVESHFVESHFVESHFIKSHFIESHFVESHFIKVISSKDISSKVTLSKEMRLQSSFLSDFVCCHFVYSNLRSVITFIDIAFSHFVDSHFVYKHFCHFVYICLQAFYLLTFKYNHCVYNHSNHR